MNSRDDLHPLADGIWSVVGSGRSNQIYDKHVALYDRLIGSGLYNRIAWGTSPQTYSSFAEQAALFGSGILLDGGCGSLVATAEMHVKSGRNTVLCDLSEGMLLEARRRVIGIAGEIPKHLIFLQADLHSLPFLSGSFGSILCLGMLHIFEDLQVVTRELSRVATTDAQLFMSSLVAERWTGRRDLRLLHRVGEVARPRDGRELTSLLDAPGSGLRAPVRIRLEGSMMFVTAHPSDAGS